MSRQPVSATREERDERGKTRETWGVAEGNLRFVQFFSAEVCLNESCANFWNGPESSAAPCPALKTSGPDHHPGCVGNAATSAGPHLCPDRLSEVTARPGRWSYKYRHWLQPHPESWLLLQIPSIPFPAAPWLSPRPGSALGSEAFICLPFLWSLSCTHDKEPARQLSDCIFLQFLAQTFSFICKAAISHSSVPTHCLMYNHILQRMNLSTQLLCYE